MLHPLDETVSRIFTGLDHFCSPRRSSYFETQMILPGTISGRGEIHTRVQTDGIITRDSSHFSVGMVNTANHYSNDASQGRSLSENAPWSTVDYKMLTISLTVECLA